MTTERSDKQARTTFLLIVCAGFLALFIFSALERVSTLISLQADVADARENIEYARQRQAELEADYEYFSSPEYVDEIARSELGYGQPGDEVLVVLPGSDDTEAGGATIAAGMVDEMAERRNRSPFRFLDPSWWLSLFE